MEHDEMKGRQAMNGYCLQSSPAHQAVALTHTKISSSQKLESIEVLCWSSCYVVDMIKCLLLRNCYQIILFIWRAQNEFLNVLPIERAFTHEKKPRRGPEKLHLLTMPDTMPRPRATRVRPSLSKKSSKLLSMAGFKEIQRRQNVTWEWSLIVVDKASI